MTARAPGALTEQAADAAIGAACRTLHLPTVRQLAGELADAATRDRLTHRAYLAEVLTCEVDERDARRRVKEARFPRVKRLEGFDLGAAPGVEPAGPARRLWHRQDPSAHRRRHRRLRTRPLGPLCHHRSPGQ
jgi:hypothetical protein